MVDEKMKEIQKHGDPLFPIAAYEWFAGNENNFSLECHWHEEWEFFSITGGSAYFSVDGVKTLISQGDILFIPSDRLHMAESVDNQPFQYRAVVFKAEILYNLGDIIHTKYIQPLLDQKGPARTFLYSDAAGKRIHELFTRLFHVLIERRSLYEIISKAALYNLFAIIFEQSDCRSQAESRQNDSIEMIKQVISYIHENYHAPLTVRQLSGIAKMSSGHFTRLFIKYTAKSPIDYVKYVRLIKASRLLTETNEKLISIAMETGFNSLSYFTRSFHNLFGYPPSVYRKVYGDGFVSPT